MRVIGADGCPGGWIAVAWETHSNTWEPHVYDSFSDLLTENADAVCIGIDIPIGLRDDGRPRGCDVAARSLLGWPRGASVFAAPQRRLLDCGSYADTLAVSQAAFGKGISRQAYGIYAKVHDVDQRMTPELQRQVVEVHPEVSFWAMNNGRAMPLSKKRIEGFDARRDLLRRSLPLDVPETRREVQRLAPGAGADDLLDALAVAWTAARYARQETVRLFAEPGVDAKGLRMEIVC